MGPWVLSNANWYYCRRHDPGKQDRQGVEDQAHVVASAGQQGVDGVASLAFEEVSVKPAIGFHVPDGGFDGRSSL
jgi:hypothetical protein